MANQQQREPSHPSAHVRLTIGRGREDEGLAAVDANVAQVVQQWVVGGTAVAQGHQLLKSTRPTIA